MVRIVNGWSCLEARLWVLGSGLRCQVLFVLNWPHADLHPRKRSWDPEKLQGNWLWPSAYIIETQTSASLESHPANMQKRGWCLLNHEHRCGKSYCFLPHCGNNGILMPTIISYQMSSTYVYSQKGWAGRFGVQ